VAAGKYQKLTRDEVGAALRGALLAVLDRDADRAEELLLRLVRSDSRDIPLYFALARLFRMRGEVGRAIRVHQNLLLRSDLDERQRLTAHGQLAEDFRQGGFLRRAIAAFEEVLERDPKNRGALEALVELHAQVRDFSRSIDLLRRRARVEGLPREQRHRLEAELWRRLAQDQASEGDHETARRSVKKALKKDRSDCEALRLLGELEAERGKPKAALAAWQKIPRLDRGRAEEIYPRLEATYAALDRSREFESYVSELLDRDPGNHGARIARARALAARGETDAAVGDLNTVLDAEPENLRARVALGRVLVAAQRETEAAEQLGELLEVLDARDDLVRPEVLE
jgi:lipopolysaccharide biosynthesis regulator YciM